MKDLINNQKGFTLIEIMTALVILSILFVSFLGFFGNSISSIFSIRSRKEALALASSKMESLYALQPLQDEDINDLIKEVNNNDQVDIKFEVKNNGEKNGYKVMIKVYYQGDKEIELTSFVRRKG